MDGFIIYIVMVELVRIGLWRLNASLPNFTGQFVNYVFDASELTIFEPILRRCRERD